MDEYNRMMFTRMIDALETLNKFNPLHNDLDAYLYEVAEYALGHTPIEPKQKDYNIAD